MKILQPGTTRTLALASLLVLATTACSSGSRSSPGDTSPTSPDSVAADTSGTQLVTADSAAQAERQFHYSGPLSDLLFGQHLYRSPALHLYLPWIQTGRTPTNQGRFQ